MMMMMMLLQLMTMFIRYEYKIKKNKNKLNKITNEIQANNEQKKSKKNMFVHKPKL